MNHPLYVTDNGLHATTGTRMKPGSLRLRIFAAVIGIAVVSFSGWANADPPSRVVRLGYLTGDVSFSPAGEDDWVRASINRPLTTGDRLWTDQRGRTELQIGGAMVRMSANTSVSILNLDNRITQLQLTQGTLNVRVRRLGSNQVFEVDTPNLAFTLRQAGEYRITVDPDGNATTIVVRKGKGEAYGEGAAYLVDARQSYRFSGTGLRDYRYVSAPRLDEFDRWSSERDRRYDTSVSARYVSQDVIGYQDLDTYGTWRADTVYGNVWRPNRVSSDWAPYRDGHWAWVDPWGWTWVDDAPWGFAVSHYGRWAHLGGAWAWVPGPVRSQAYYAPALVVFVGGNNFQVANSGGNVGGVGWFPLGPREVYQPSYAVSRSYFENINRSNTVVNTTVINNYYNNTNVTNVIYANRGVTGAIIAVPTTAFVQSQQVSKAAVRVTQNMVASTPLAIAAPIVPTERSVRGNAGPGNKPPAKVFERPIIARTTPAAEHLGFAAQQPQLTAKPGRPLDDAARKELKAARSEQPPSVKVVAPTQAAPPTMLPPPKASDAKPGADERGKPEQRGNNDQRNNNEQRDRPGAPAQKAAPPPQAAPQPVAPPVQPAESRGKSEQRGNSDQRERPAAPVQRTAPPPPQAAPQPAAPPVQAAEPRGRPEQRGNSDQRERPGAPPARVTQPPPPAADPMPVQRPAPAAARPPAPPQAQPAPNAEPRNQEGKPRPNADKRKNEPKDKEDQTPDEEARGRKK